MTSDEDVVAFFFALPASRRRDYAALAELDRRFGEDVEAELQGRAEDAGRLPRRGRS